MSKRHRDALAIIDDACNPGAIARAIVAAGDPPDLGWLVIDNYYTRVVFRVEHGAITQREWE